jgi:hypothetical protein
MSPLNRLTMLLGGLVAKDLPPAQTEELLCVTRKLEKRVAPTLIINEGQQIEAVLQFWKTQKLDSFKNARLISFGLCLPVQPGGPCILEDRERFLAALNGLTAWAGQPRWFRRCYQGLMRCYFSYDIQRAKTPEVGKANWLYLRSYLHAKSAHIHDSLLNPDWVSTVRSNLTLFGDDPCHPYAQDMLNGNKQAVDGLCEQLGIDASSWFQRELILSPIRWTTTREHREFVPLIRRLLELLSGNPVLRDRGLALVLDKYASAQQPTLHEQLKNVVVTQWGNPWLPSHATRWGGVTPAARQMVSEWLKREFVEAFFTKLAQDGVGDRRRANFWLRYVNSMDNVQFALGSKALNSKEADFKVLRQKMHGLYTELRATDSANNAFIMQLGELVVVEFGGKGNALYGYAANQNLPFDASRPVLIAVDEKNSLKHTSRLVKLLHKDHVDGWNQWEDRFEALLREQFSICPMTGSPVAKRSPKFPERFSTNALVTWATAHQLTLDDKIDQGGCLWVLVGATDLTINQTLQNWGFRHKPGKGWWRQSRGFE